MSLNSTPSADRVHIGIFGRRNAGKSSIINAITGQNLAIVSDVLGTTTDPVPKAMELLPLGPVVIIDTPGLDDIGELGELRVKKAYQILNKTDIAVLVIDASLGMSKDMGLVTLTNSHLFPGKGVNKKLPAIGDMSITGIVNLSGHTGANLLQNTRLYTVKQMAEYIGKALIYADHHLSSPL